MSITKLVLFSAIAVVPIAAVSSNAASDDRKSNENQGERKSIAEIVELLEGQDYGPLVEISFDDGVWEVETYRGRESLELAVDPVSGEILSEHRDDSGPRPPQDGLVLSELLAKLADAGHTGIEEVSFERRYWEVELRRDNEKRELHVHPVTGEVIADRKDD